MKALSIQPYNNHQDKTLDINYVLSNRTFIKPLKPQGHIVNDSILNKPAEISKDVAYDVKSMRDSRKGKANDHQLGKVNDIGMKLGGLAIAAYLITKKTTPLTKLMELVGFASFFGAMALWPKIALQLPARLIHGFDIRQKYEDSFGRKKMFFQDPQYIPWDLMDDKTINKIGDRMNVPKDMVNRRDYIQEKMRKIAVQNNTLWMYTAGLATPVASALMCNLCEKPLNKYLDKKHSEYADNLLKNFSNNYLKYQDETLISELDKVLSGTFNPEKIEQIKSLFTKNLDSVTSKSVVKDLDKLLTPKAYEINERTIDKFYEQIKMILKDVKVDLPSKNALIEALGGNYKTALDTDATKQAIRLVQRPVVAALKANPNGELLIDEILQKTGDIFYENKICNLNDEIRAKLKGFAKIFTKFNAKSALLDEYAYLKVGAAPETVIANAFDGEKLLKIFDFTDKEITQARYDRSFVSKLLREKLEKITSSGEYEKVMKSLMDKVNDVDTKINAIENTGNASYKAVVNSSFEEAASKLMTDMPHTAESLVGKNGSDLGSLKRVKLEYARNRVLGVKSSLYRLINTLDFYKRISSLTNIDALHSQMPLEVKEEIVEFAKKICLEGTTSDFMTKFYALRNPNPSQELGELEVQAGKVINKFKSGIKVNIPSDSNFFKEVMRLLYQNDVHPDTANLLAGTQKEQFLKYRHDFLHGMGNYEYFAKPFHMAVDGVGSSKVTNMKNFLRCGMAPDQMLHSVINKKYNTNKWLKMFGIFGASLLGITVLAQFFFGKISEANND